VPGRSHFLVQFAQEPDGAQLQALADRGAKVLSYVPDFALSVAARDGISLRGMGVQWVGRLQPDEKISPELSGKLGPGHDDSEIVEFYSDVSDGDARTIANETGVVIRDNPDLLPHHLLIQATGDQVRQLANWDEVSYIFPASPELVHGLPVHACAGALTTAGPVGQAIPLVGDGWDGPGLGSANLNYAFVQLTEKAPADSVESEIRRAYSQWAKYAQITFTQASTSTSAKTLAILFASRAHGDGYPFDGPGGVLAHTFYPYPLNAEPIAGDMHFDNDESWRVGADVDAFSVALHEIGHALGLGHSDSPRDVMYPYYHIVSALGLGDIAAIQQLYAARTSSDAPAKPTPEPLALSIQTPLVTTTASSIALSGTTSGGSGAVQVSWSTNHGASGMAQGSSSWTIAAIPLSARPNVITVTARDSDQDQVSQSVTVTVIRQPPSAAPSPPANPGAGPDTVPPSIRILSPAMTNVATSGSSIVVSGTAQDNVGVSQVTWSSSTGASGTAAGTSNWSSGPVPLYIGTTTIIVYANDWAGNRSWRSLTVTRY
jgi:Matrixin/Bacterial Ig domain